MLDSILGLVHYGVLLLFGVYLSAAFLGIEMKRRNVMILFGFYVVSGLMNALIFTMFGMDFTERIYPLVIHLPLIIFLVVFYKYKLISTVLSVLSAYLCCQLSNWVGLFVINLTSQKWAYYTTRIIIDLALLFLLIRFVSAAMAQILQKRTKDIVIFGMIPFVYYLYDYAVSVYKVLSYSSGEVITEFLGFILCIFYIVFLIIYFKQYEEKQEAEQLNQLMEMQRMQSQKEVEMMKRSEFAVSIMRHDMRHFLSDIAGFIENEDKDRALAYIGELIENVDNTATKKYCNNKIVNMILTSYENIIEQQEIDFDYSIKIPKELGISDIDISSILSNGIENAVHAASMVSDGKRRIELNMHMNNSKLLISIKNTYVGKAKLVDGLPQTSETGHGFGTKSIRYTTEKLKGNCQFAVDDEYFILRIVL